MDLITIVITVCGLAQPNQCEEQRLAFSWQGTLRQCVMNAQPYIAQWIGDHPKWSVKSYHCEYPHMKEKADARGSARPNVTHLNKIGTRPVIMGILNLTPDSFSDGGRFVAAEAARSHAKRMAAEGCDIIDIGAESTRPGAVPAAEPEEFARMKSVLTELADTLEVPFSIDSYKSNVAARAVA